ncbi:MAG: DUF3365 domain-containing protein [Pirellulales bacterium]
MGSTLRFSRGRCSIRSVCRLGIGLLVLVALSKGADAQDAVAPEKPTLEVAKERAKVMTEVHLATLEVIHDRYFHGERAMVPARAMEEVFDKLRKQNGVESRWIAVNLKPMSITHEPKTEFEKKAARELEKGKAYWDEVEDGVYRRATPVPLTSICVNCHAGFFRDPPTHPLFAGLVISIPIR